MLFICPKCGLELTAEEVMKRAHAFLGDSDHDNIITFALMRSQLDSARSEVLLTVKLTCYLCRLAMKADHVIERDAADAKRETDIKEKAEARATAKKAKEEANKPVLEVTIHEDDKEGEE